MNVLIINLMLLTAPVTTYDEVYKECIRQGILHPHIVTAQAVLECGWQLNSNNAITRNNLFGLRRGNRYVKFDTWQQSVAYYKERVQARYRGGDYYEFLDRIGYAEDPKYIHKLKQVKEKL